MNRYFLVTAALGLPGWRAEAMPKPELLPYLPTLGSIRSRNKLEQALESRRNRATSGTGSSNKSARVSSASRPAMRPTDQGPLSGALAPHLPPRGAGHRRVAESLGRGGRWAGCALVGPAPCRRLGACKGRRGRHMGQFAFGHSLDQICGTNVEPE